MYDAQSGESENQPFSYLETQKELEHWFQTKVGRSLLASQRRRLSKLIERCYGFHQAEIAVSHRIPVGNGSSLGHRFIVVPQVESDMPDYCLVSHSTELALDHDSADLVILHHALDFSEDPHQTLREVERILKPNGNLALVGFNPMSLWGAIKLLSPTKSGVWRNRFLSGRRVADWLSLLNLRVDMMRYYYYAPPINSVGVLSRFSWIESIVNSKVPLGAYYVIMAQKQQIARIMPSRSWKRKTNVVGLPVANRASKIITEESLKN